MVLKTVRTEGSYDSYDSRRASYIKKETVFLVHGHTHKDTIGNNFISIGSAGYDGLFSEVHGILVIADLHLGIPDLVVNQKKVVKTLKDGIWKEIIFLGDTFDMCLMKDQEILTDTTGFWEWYFGNKTSKITFIIGNHDINLEDTNNEIRKILLERKNTYITDIYDICKTRFMHGHQFDKYCSGFYLFLFKILDYINIPMKVVDWFLKKIGRGRN